MKKFIKSKVLIIVALLSSCCFATVEFSDSELEFKGLILNKTNTIKISIMNNSEQSYTDVEVRPTCECLSFTEGTFSINANSQKELTLVAKSKKAYQASKIFLVANKKVLSSVQVTTYFEPEIGLSFFQRNSFFLGRKKNDGSAKVKPFEFTFCDKNSTKDAKLLELKLSYDQELLVLETKKEVLKKGVKWTVMPKLTPSVGVGKFDQDIYCLITDGDTVNEKFKLNIYGEILQSENQKVIPLYSQHPKSLTLQKPPFEKYDLKTNLAKIINVTMTDEQITIHFEKGIAANEDSYILLSDKENEETFIRYKVLK